MDRLYRSFGSGEKKIFRPEYLHFTGISDLGDIKSRSLYVRTLDRMHPHYAKDAMMEAGLLVTNPNLAGLSDRDHKTAEITLAQMLYFQGMSEEVYEYFSSYINTCEPDAEFLDYESNQIKIICENFLADREIINLVGRMRPRKIMTRDYIRSQYYLRLNFMQRLADRIAEAHGHPSVPVVFDEFPKIIARAAGIAVHGHTVRGVPKTGIILINARPDTINSIARMVNLIGHEMRHILDYKLSHDAMYGDMVAQDINFIHAGMVALNSAAYVSASLSDQSGTGKQSLSEQFNRYASQYMERAARNFGEKLENNLSPALPEIFDPSAHLMEMHLNSMH